MRVRPNVRVQASDAKCTETVSGDRVFTIVTAQYLNGQLVFPAQRHMLRVERKP